MCKPHFVQTTFCVATADCPDAALPCCGGSQRLQVYHDPESVGCVADGDGDGGTGPAEAKTDLLVPSQSKHKTASAVGVAGAEGYTSTASFTLHDAMQSAPFYVLCADQVSGCILGARHRPLRLRPVPP